MALARRGDLLLQAVSVRFADGYPAAARSSTERFRRSTRMSCPSKRACDSCGSRPSSPPICGTNAAWDRLTSRHLKIVREAGALSALPLALNTRVFVQLYAGDLVAASATVRRDQCGDRGGRSLTRAVRRHRSGRLPRSRSRSGPLIATAMSDVAQRGEGIGVALTHWAKAMLCNGLGQLRRSPGRSADRLDCPEEMGVSNWGLVELIEAAVRAGDLSSAAIAFERLDCMTRASGTEWALGLAARSEAQLQTESQQKLSTGRLSNA